MGEVPCTIAMESELCDELVKEGSEPAYELVALDGSQADVTLATPAEDEPLTAESELPARIEFVAEPGTRVLHQRSRARTPERRVRHAMKRLGGPVIP